MIINRSATDAAMAINVTSREAAAAVTGSVYMAAKTPGKVEATPVVMAVEKLVDAAIVVSATAASEKPVTL